MFTGDSADIIIDRKDAELHARKLFYFWTLLYRRYGTVAEEGSLYGNPAQSCGDEFR